MASDIDFMRLALKEAEKAFNEDEVPVGAVLVIKGEIIARAHNKRESAFDPTAHAEVIVMREAAQKIKNWRLIDATIYVTKEPCIMCAGAMVNARLGRLVYGCGDIKAGAVQSLYQLLSDKRLNHQVEVVSGMLEEECAALLKKFFKGRR
ncbi:MAG: tRNA adenosine(34) deaminase TadA [Thermodesulfovibrionales bacterium]|jgi:tRNA(adenine34) deaminase|nr:tRNA adenosine(34) deaminase TadA [Thermodesulfovibrionales bacterium]